LRCNPKRELLLKKSVAVIIIVLFFTHSTFSLVWRPTISLDEARFTDATLSVLIITFNETLNNTLDYTKCETVFTVGTKELLGNSALCRQYSSDSILVSPGIDGLVRPGSNLTSNVANFVDLAIVIDSAALIRPELRLSGINDNLCPCDDDYLVFTLDDSTNLGYSLLRNIEWTVEWQAFLPIPPPESSSAMALLSSTMPPLFVSSSEILSSSISSMSSSSPILSSSILSSQSEQFAPISSPAVNSSAILPMNSSEALGMMTSSSEALGMMTSSSEVLGMMTSSTEVLGMMTSSSVPQQMMSSSSVPLAALSSSYIDTATSSSVAEPTPDVSSSVFYSSSAIPTTTPAPQRTPPSFNYTQYLNPYQGSSSQLRLPLSIFNRSNIYQIKVKAMNVFGHLGEAVQNISFHFTCGPTTVLRRVAHTDVVYEAIVYYPSCWNGNTNRLFEWSDSTSSLSVVGGPQTPSSIHVIKRSLLTSGVNYTVSLLVNESWSQEASVQRTETFTFTARPLVARVLGKSISIGSNATLTLDCSECSDPDNLAGPGAAETKQWRCLNAVDDSPCRWADGTAITSNKETLQLKLLNETFQAGQR